jgi:DNA gyrase subunit A
MERDKIDSEFAEVQKITDYCRGILADDEVLLGVVKQELVLRQVKYSFPSVTNIWEDSGEFRFEDVIANECHAVTVTNSGFSKRTPVKLYRSQKPGGKGAIGAGQQDEDAIKHFFTANMHNNVICVMDSGGYTLKRPMKFPMAGVYQRDVRPYTWPTCNQMKKSLRCSVFKNFRWTNT